MAATFSYAQAAKGISSPVSVSKPTSGSATPAKDDASKAPITSIAQVNSWADDAETESSTEQPTTNAESRTTSSKPTKPAESLEASTTDLDSLSASTVTKDDDTSSQPNMSSESTWDNKSQASTSVDKTIEPVQKTSEKPEKGEKGRKGKKGEKSEKKEAEKEKEPPKPLKEAPLPTVNIWQQRADQQKSQSKPVTSSVTNGAPKKSSPEGRPTTAEAKPKGPEDDKAASLRKDTRGDAEKKGAKGRPYDKDVKPASSAMPLPPNQDQDSWPTPETAVDEDRKKAQEKGEKERKDSAPNGTSGKHEWVKVPYTPSVVFNTPLPNAANSRRGGRSGGRGGAQSGGRPAGFGANGIATSEKDAPTDAVANGEQSKREVNGVAGDASPKSKRSGSAASPILKEQVPAVNGEKSLKGPGAAPFEPEAPKRASTVGEMPNGTFPRQYSGRPGKGRRGDFNGPERRREGDVSPTKDTNQTESSENERRPFDGPNGVHSKQGRYNSSYAGRDRPRGGGRGARGGFTNGHHFTNGHAQQASGSFTMVPGSPTTFNPGSNSFFAPPQGKFGRNNHRSQSVAEPYRYPAFQGAPQIAPLNTYNMYDYNMAAPMSTMPYNPYGVDQFALFQMITTQVEYYFSVDNLLKDMYLRRHMDSQGFVALDFICAFNRIKNLTTDIELIKLVCQQSSHVQYRTGEDGRDRLRRREGWEPWVLSMAERDVSAQNEGPKELHNPPVPNPAGFDQSNPPQYPTMHTGYGHDVSYPEHNPFVPSAPQDATGSSTEILANGTTPEGANGTAVPNGQPIEELTKAVSAEPDSFSDAQMESLTVIVRKQNKSLAALRPSASRTFSNGSLDSKSGGVDELDSVLNCQSRATGAVASHDCENGSDQSPKLGVKISTLPVRLYWVKDEEHPVDSVPSDITHESYFQLRSKALQQRQNTPFGSTCYDMEVLYQFWSHFLIRNFNTQMYEEFRTLAFEDALYNMTDVGLSSLIKLYSQSLLSSQTVVRHRVVRDYVALVESEDDDHCPAFTQLQSDFSSSCLDSGSQQRLEWLLNDDLLALLKV